MITTLLGAEGAFFVGTFWAFVPAIVAIALALITKQVYLSLFAGIFLGTMFLAEGNIVYALGITFEKMGESVGGNIGILVFLVMLGILVILMSKAGGTKAYGDWAASKIHSSRGALGATAGLGAMIFVDDYFNCLTVGNVMRPVTDKFKVSRAKLAYLIDSTAAPICIIAPISSWAAAVSSYTPEGESGLILFIKTIPFNVYALLTLAMVIFVIVRKFDFGKMKRNEINAANGDLLSGETDLPTEDIPQNEISNRGKVQYLIVPIVALILFCVGSMIYSGYFYDWDAGRLGATPVEGMTFIESFASCDAGSSLAIGSTLAVIFTMIYYFVTKAVDFKGSMDSIAKGFKSMVPAILILICAWTISGVMGAKGAGIDEAGAIALDGSLNAKAFVQANINAESLGMGIIPAILFVLAALISFATGTSWGTFGLLIPIALTVTDLTGQGLATSAMSVLAMSAVLAGSVYGDHVSPISDTTILASSGAQCNHVDHVRTQMPYATLVAIVCFITYVCAGFATQAGISYGVSVVITLAIGGVLLAGTLAGVYYLEKFGKFDKLYSLLDARRLKKNKHALAVEGDMANASIVMTDDIVANTAPADVNADDSAENTTEVEDETAVEESANADSDVKED